LFLEIEVDKEIDHASSDGFGRKPEEGVSHGARFWLVEGVVEVCPKAN